MLGIQLPNGVVVMGKPLSIFRDASIKNDEAWALQQSYCWATVGTKDEDSHFNVFEESVLPGALQLPSLLAGHAEGSGAKAYGFAAHAEGFDTHAYGPGSHAQGWRTYASGAISHAEGQDCRAMGIASHA